ncbi:hypothetical protein B296_00012631 [Ensete ventricosum]|uniref:Uncharacterized protein n=1 Tax=Ensete ventricosum TaxID=4639 RepID=A0A426ZAF3_ENSVE|nr:hypothetical protein B296_00012631 [Ensete ventricosum]
MLAKGIGSLLGWRRGVRPTKTETRRKIIGGSRKAYRDLGIRPSLDDEVRSHREFARRFAEGIEKLIGNMKGDRREEDQRTCHKNAGSYQIMRELGLI